MNFRSPTDEPLHIALTSGHTAVVTSEGSELHAMFHREAISRGAVPFTVQYAPAAAPAAPQFDRGQIIADALNTMLDGGQEGDFTGDGKPNLTKLNARVGFKVAREEADAAWAKVSATAPAAAPAALADKPADA